MSEQEKKSTEEQQAPKQEKPEAHQEHKAAAGDTVEQSKALFNQAVTWAKANPIPAAVIGVLVLLVLWSIF